MVMMRWEELLCDGWIWVRDGLKGVSVYIYKVLWEKEKKIQILKY